MKIILLSGKSNCGKTRAMNMVYDEMKKVSKELMPKKQVGGNVDDFETVMLYNNKNIALFSMGDILKEIIHAIKKYMEMDIKIDVLVICCRTEFLGEVKEKYGIYVIKVIEKSRKRGKNKHIESEEKCREIINTLNENMLSKEVTQ